MNLMVLLFQFLIIYRIEANKSIDTPIYSRVLNNSYSNVVAEPVVEIEKHERQQTLPKINDFNEFPPVLAEKKKKKSRTKKTLKIMSNSLPCAEVVNPSINYEIQNSKENDTTKKDLTVTSFEIADETLLFKDKTVENIKVNPSNISLHENIPLTKKPPSMYNEFFQLNHEYNLENEHLNGDKLGSITSILNDLMMNNVTGKFLDICLIDVLKNVISDPSSITLKVRDISTSFCNKPIELQAKRDLILKRMIIVSWKKFSNTIYLANTMLGYNQLISMMDKIQRERNTECRKQLKAELEDALDLRYCAINLVKFLGELVNFGILSPKIIQSLKPLLDINVNSITIECFCEFFKTVGLKMETELGNVIMNECFLKLVNILNMFHTQTIILCPSVSILISEVLQLRLSLKVN